MKLRIFKKLFVLTLSVIMLFGCIQPVSAVSQWFFQNHTDWHFDLTKEPDRPMTVEEFIALTLAYSWASVGEGGTTPRDRDGDLPADWAAPYIREQARKQVIDPSTIDYQANVTLAFAMKYLVNCNGLYGYNAVNVRKFSGTAGLDTEQKLCLNTAVDYGYFPYTENMNVSVTIPRRDVEAKYLIHTTTPSPVTGVIPRSSSFNKSMVFFEDTYVSQEAFQRQFDILKKNKDSYNIVSLDTVYLKSEKISHSLGFEFVGDAIGAGQNPRMLEVVDFCRENGKMILGGVFTWYDTAIFNKLRNNPAAQKKAVEELVKVVETRNLDGLNFAVELDGNYYRQTYSELVTQLSAELHKRGKTLMLSVGGCMWAKDEAYTLYDYSVINKVADLITLVTYDLYSAKLYNNGGQMGPISEMSFTSRATRYAANYFDPEKILLGVGGYGIRFCTSDHTADNITMDEVLATAAKYNVTPKNQGPEKDDCYFSYREGGKNYTIFYESDATMKRRIDLVTSYGLGGVAGFYVSGNHSTMFSEMEKGLSDLPFGDVGKQAWYYDSVKFVYEHNLFNGTSASTFGPEETMTRAMLVTVLWRYEGKPAPAAKANFSDVPVNEWYAEAVAWANENGIVNGTGRGKFGPNEDVTREQMATILLRYAQKKGLPVNERADISAFPDHDKVESWAVDAFRWAVATKIINGTTDDRTRIVILDPQGNATRCQVAKILRVFIQTYGE